MLQHKTTQNANAEQNQQDHNHKAGFLPLTELDATTTQRRSTITSSMWLQTKKETKQRD
jgi:hypothetical protein